jgi:hypothetical protein
MDIAISRVDFLKLVGMSRDAFDGRDRRGQLPFVFFKDGKPRHMTFGPVPPLADGSDPYTAWGCILTAVADALSSKAERVSLVQACIVAGALSDELQKRWPDIVRASGAILCGSADLASRPSDNSPPWRPLVGTMTEIARQLDEVSVPIAGVNLANASLVVDRVRARAQAHGIDLGDFWSPSPPEPGAEKAGSSLAAISRRLHRT